MTVNIISVGEIQFHQKLLSFNNQRWFNLQNFHDLGKGVSYYLPYSSTSFVTYQNHFIFKSKLVCCLSEGCRPEQDLINRCIFYTTLAVENARKAANVTTAIV